MNRHDLKNLLTIIICVVVLAMIIGAGAWWYFKIRPQASHSTLLPDDQTAAKIQQFYDSYSQNPSSSARKPYLDPELAANLDSQSSASDPILCAQNLPRQIQASLYMTSDTAKVIRVVETFASNTRTVDVTVRASDQIITAIACR